MQEKIQVHIFLLTVNIKKLVIFKLQLQFILAETYDQIHFYIKLYFRPLGHVIFERFNEKKKMKTR